MCVCVCVCIYTSSLSLSLSLYPTPHIHAYLYIHGVALQVYFQDRPLLLLLRLPFRLHRKMHYASMGFSVMSWGLYRPSCFDADAAASLHIYVPVLRHTHPYMCVFLHALRPTNVYNIYYFFSPSLAHLLLRRPPPPSSSSSSIYAIFLVSLLCLYIPVVNVTASRFGPTFPIVRPFLMTLHYARENGTALYPLSKSSRGRRREEDGEDERPFDRISAAANDDSDYTIHSYSLYSCANPTSLLSVVAGRFFLSGKFSECSFRFDCGCFTSLLNTWDRE